MRKINQNYLVLMFSDAGQGESAREHEHRFSTLQGEKDAHVIAEQEMAAWLSKEYGNPGTEYRGKYAKNVRYELYKVSYSKVQ